MNEKFLGKFRGVGLGGQGGCERRIEVFVKIQTSSPKGNDRSPENKQVFFK